jgi:hypothetical protein
MAGCGDNRSRPNVRKRNGKWSGAISCERYNYCCADWIFCGNVCQRLLTDYSKRLSHLQNDEINAASWGVKGKISDDRRQIIWDNNVVWGRPSELDLDGPWLYNGKRVAIQFDSRDTIFLTNERGASAKAFLKGEKLLVPMWNLEGIVSEDRHEIVLENGSVWKRLKLKK